MRKCNIEFNHSIGQKIRISSNKSKEYEVCGLFVSVTGQKIVRAKNATDSNSKVIELAEDTRGKYFTADVSPCSIQFKHSLLDTVEHKNNKCKIIALGIDASNMKYFILRVGKSSTYKEYE